MTNKLKEALLFAMVQSGSYDPDQTLHYIADDLTNDEYTTAVNFLESRVDNDFNFGPDNFDQLFSQFDSQRRMS